MIGVPLNFIAAKYPSWLTFSKMVMKICVICYQDETLFILSQSGFM